jgi:hypothetical protein
MDSSGLCDLDLVKATNNNNLVKKTRTTRRNKKHWNTEDRNKNNKNSNKKSKRGSYSNGEGPAINRGGIRGVRHFACKFPQKVARCVADVVL